MDTLTRNVTRYVRVINHSLFTINGNLDYDRLTVAFTALANVINEADETDESLWYIGEDYCCLVDLIVGAYWHYTEWHGGQWSPEYAALSALGAMFNPNMSCPEPENETYILLNQLAQEL